MVVWQNELKHLVARVARKVPFAIALKRKLLPSITPKFTTSDEYWKARYDAGGNSGEGSYGNLAHYKASFLNAFIEQNNIGFVFELGCGDGNQLSKLVVKKYVGVDISQYCLDACKKATIGRNFDFMTPRSFDQNYRNNSIDLGLSLDVVYHLIEDTIYFDYMKRLFSTAGKFVIIYASNFEGYDEEVPHVRHRNFTKYVVEQFPQWSLVKQNENPLSKDHKSLEYGSFAKFFVFERN